MIINTGNKYLLYNYSHFCTGTYRYEVKMYVFDCSYHTITITFVPYSVSIREPSYLQVGRSSALGRSSAWRSLGVLVAI